MGNKCDWLENAVFYEIYPQSFKDTDGDGIGNINGITEKLEYIKGLGCNAIWINPCFDSPFGDAGYDVSDYYKVAPRYGTNGDLAKMAFAFLLSMPGAPYIYYGDEIGMRYIEGLTSVEGGYNRTGSRSPMQWNRDLNAGFSTKTVDDIRDKASLKNGSCLYVPIDPDEDRPNVADQQKDNSSLLNEVKKLTEIRRSHKALMNSGDIKFICDGAPGKPLVYVRTSGAEQILAAFNPTDKDYEIELPRSDKDAAAENKIDEKNDIIYNLGEKPVINGGHCTIKAVSAFFMGIPER